MQTEGFNKLAILQRSLGMRLYLPNNSEIQSIFSRYIKYLLRLIIITTPIFHTFGIFIIAFLSLIIRIKLSDCMKQFSSLLFKQSCQYTVYRKQIHNKGYNLPVCYPSISFSTLQTQLFLNYLFHRYQYI